MKFYGQLEKVAFEVLASDPTAGVQGRFWYNSTEARVKSDDGTNNRALLRNDLKCVIGNNGTANNNIRLHRAASPVLQLVAGGDATAEGSLSTSLAQLSARVENYATVSAPSAGANEGRLYWDTTTKTMFVDNGTAWISMAGGGGGGSIQWYEDANAPILSLNAAFLEEAAYGAGLGQSLYCVVKVPNSYIAGTQIKMRLPFASNDTSGDALLQTIATLIRSGTDAYTSTTNQRTSTNAAVTLSGGTQNKPQMVIFDLTSSTGTINSVAVAANDLIIVKLTRGTDTATSDLLTFINAADLQFT